MATASDTVHTDYAATPRVLGSAANTAGVLQTCSFSYEASGLESGSTISIGVPVPKGAVLREIVIAADDLGTTAGTLAVGDADSTARFMAAYATGSATFKRFTADGKIGAFNYEFPEDTQLLITTAGASITGTIVGWFAYSVV